MSALNQIKLSRHRSLELKRPLSIRLGEAVLLLFFIALLSGRFTLDRLFEQSSGFDLRYLFLGLGIITVFLWMTGARGKLPSKVSMIGSFPLIFWSLWMILSAAWAPYEAEIGKAITDFVFMAAFVLLSWLVMAFLPVDSLDRIWKWIIVVGLIYFFLAIVSGPDVQGRYAAPGGGPNTFVRMMVTASIAAFYLVLVKKRNLPLLSLPFFAVGAALSGSRGGLLAAAIVFVLFFIPTFKFLQTKRAAMLLASVLVGFTLALQWNNHYLWRFVEDRFIVQTFGEKYYSGRDIITEQAIGMYLDHFFIGVGLDGFVAHQDGISVEYAHNLVLSVLAESGTVGGLLLAILLVRLVLAANASIREPCVLFFLMTGLYYFSTALFSGDYYDSRFIWFFLGLAAIASARSRAGSSPGSRLEAFELAKQSNS